VVSISVEENKRLMKTLDDAWNSQEWETFNKRHHEEVAVYWPGQPEPTRGQRSHQEEAEQFFKTFPDNHVGNDPYKVLIGEGDWTCSVAKFTGTMSGPMPGPDGTMIQPTNKSFEVEFCTVAHWNEKGEIVQEKLFYDLEGLMKQIGLM
jgi:SnoaL-like polyketide cyclase.